ncbi:MFS transporter [Microlunatus elymi]|uniref:MFS transporter n=1 Tax=Microlunatus elymi TaxID=2596828 RepID=A0A516PU71_9ACTN|nr:MFS transporter [Microlunatus elymi]QDP94693.1 MFS transporter [Microlunatus elymi]
MTGQQYAVRAGWRSGSAGFGLYVGASTLAGLGSTMLAFAVNWEATGFGARIAGLVATLGALPRAILMLLGGAIADRHGIRRIMIICDACMTTILISSLSILIGTESTLPVIIGLSVLGGAISAFYLPAAGGFVRLFVPAERLPKVMARVGGVQQVARLVGPGLGALVVVAAGLIGALGANLISYLVIMVALLVVRPPIRLAADSGEHPAVKGTAGQVLDGLRQAGRTAGMPAALGSLALVAGGVLPVIYLGVPLLVREQGRGVRAAGWIESAWIVGSLLVTVIMARWGAYRRAGG